MLATALYIFSLIIVLGYTSVIFFIAQFKKDNSIIDILYGLGFIITAYTLMLEKMGGAILPSSSVVILILITLWGIRLSLRIFIKNKGKPEDFRYATWRTQWMRKGIAYYYARSYLQIFILQGCIISLVLLPFTLSLTTTAPPDYRIVIGILIWILGFVIESVGDRQLDRFIKSKAVNKGTIMQTGLWKYSRHPNYFGESMMWFGIACISLSTGASYLVLLSPFLITYLLLFVSGIPLLEKKWEGIPEWEVYKRTTSAFIPLPKKK